MSTRNGLRLALIAALVANAIPSASAEVDQAAARNIPWSGYWFPTAKGELLEPLRKYDALTGGNALRWELSRNPPGQHIPAWHGYCHGWAAASILEREPNQQLMASVGGGSVLIGVADQKGWYAACHSGDAANWFGDRYGDGQGSEDPNDMRPDMLWQLLKMFIKDQGVPLVMDLDPGPEVWNYPVYAYRIEYQPHPNGGGWQMAQLSLWAADDAVPPDFVGLVPHFQTYTFQFLARGGAIVAGSATWVGQSLGDHPDFAWYPFVVRPDNPELQYPLVRRLIQGSTPAGPPQLPQSPAAPQLPQTPLDGSAPANMPQIPNFSSPIAQPRPTGPAQPPFSAAGPVNRPEIPGFNPPANQPQPEVRTDPIPVSPIQLVAAVANRTSQFDLDLRTAEFGKTQYSIGDRLKLAVSSGQGGYLYLLHINPAGELTLLYPRRASEPHRITAEGTFRFPPVGNFEVSGPIGNHYVKAIVTRQPLLFTGLSHEAPAEANAPRWQGRSLRLCPTQTELIKSLLQDHVGGKTLNGRELAGSFVLPEFAQDELTYYVGPSR